MVVKGFDATLTQSPLQAEQRERAQAAHVHGQPQLNNADQNRLEETPLIDMAYFEELRDLDQNGGMGLAREVIGIFLDTSAQAVAQVNSALAQADVVALGKAAHALKSSSANVGAQRLSGYYQRMEKLCQAQDMPAAFAMVEEVLREHALALQKLKEVKVQLV